MRERNTLAAEVAEPVSTNTVVAQPVAAVAKKRCAGEGCNIKLMLTDMPCKCEKRFCGRHRVPEDHKCSFDYRAAGKALLTTNLVKVESKKLDYI
jgi:predicted nucleic acid binding AN1-type Zn finger protein